MGRLDGKVAIITGAGTGIGRASAILFAKEGAKVVVASRNTAGTGEETVRMIKEAGGKAIFVKTDVSKAENVKNMIKTTVDTYGKLDILYNNAGVAAGTGDITQMTEEQWNRGISINLTGTFLGMKYGIPEMIKAGGGVIISTSSLAGIIGFGSAPADYGASKAGIIMLTKTAAFEFARQNIRANCICPTHCATPLFESYDVAGDEERRKKLNNMPLIGRVGTAEEIAQIALFLACDDSSLITGEAVVADGGHASLIRGYDPGYDVLSP